MKPFFLFTIILTAATTLATQELDPESFQQLTSSGKNGMVKFYQSWCGHCMRMKPDWDRLAEEAPSDVFIADVHCEDQYDLCEANNVRGYPTIKYWLDGQEHSYEGGRSFDDLNTFVLEELATQCTFSDMTRCSEKAKAYMAKWDNKTSDEKKQEMERLQAMAQKSMKADLKRWVVERARILKSGVVVTGAEKDGGDGDGVGEL